jgi:MFS family permease
MAVYVGLSAAPWRGGLLTQHLGWQSIFYTNAIASLLVIVGIVYKVKAEWAEARNDPFDMKGTVIYVISMLALMYGFSKLPGNFALAVTVAGIAGIVTFAVIEERTECPVLDIKLFTRNRIFAFSNLAALINYAATFGISFVLSLYLQNVKGMSPSDAGLFLMIQPSVMAIVGSVSGSLSDRIDSRILSSAGMAIIVIGLLMLAYLKIDTSSAYMVISLIMLGFGFGLFSSPNTNSVMSSWKESLDSSAHWNYEGNGQMFSHGYCSYGYKSLYRSLQKKTQVNRLFYECTKDNILIFAVLCSWVFLLTCQGGKRIPKRALHSESGITGGWGASLIAALAISGTVSG